MEKKQKHLIIGIIGLVVLVVMYFGVKVLADKKQAKDEAESEADKIYVTDYEVSDVKKVSYTCDGEEIELVKDNDTWSSTSDASLNLSTSDIEAFLETFNHLEAKSRLDGEKDNEEYEMSTPTNVLTVTLLDNTVYTYTIGGYNSVSSIYYMTLNDSDDVYAISSVAVQKLDKTLDDFVEETTQEETTTEDTTQEDTTTEDITQEDETTE